MKHPNAPINRLLTDFITLAYEIMDTEDCSMELAIYNAAQVYAEFAGIDTTAPVCSLIEQEARHDHE